MIDGLLLIVEAQKRRFPDGLDPFKMLTRLLEECGELATEVQVWEDEGLKRAKHGQPDRVRTAAEVVNVLTATLTIADHYGVLGEVAERVRLAVDVATADGYLADQDGPRDVEAVEWSRFEAANGELARHVQSRLTGGLSYLSTIRPDGFPRVHPIGAHVRDGRLLVPMKPTSPKGKDIKRDGRFALHCSVEDSQGGEGEVLVTGLGTEMKAPDDMASRGWTAFNLLIADVLSVRHLPDEDRPHVERWKPA